MDSREPAEDPPSPDAQRRRIRRLVIAGVTAAGIATTGGVALAATGSDSSGDRPGYGYGSSQEHGRDGQQARPDGSQKSGEEGFGDKEGCDGPMGERGQGEDVRPGGPGGMGPQGERGAPPDGEQGDRPAPPDAEQAQPPPSE